MSDEPSKPGDAQPMPQSPLVIPVSEFVERVLPESDAEAVARYRATLEGPPPEPALPAIEPDKFPLDPHTKPLSSWEAGAAGFLAILLGVAGVWFAFHLLTATPKPAIAAVRPASPSIVFPTEQPSVAADRLTVPPVTVPEERKEQGKVGGQGEKKTTNRPRKRVTAHAPRKRFYRRYYYRSRDDGSFM